MKQPKPLSKYEINERALSIACDLFALDGKAISDGAGPATARQIRRYLRNMARKELLAERKEKNRTGAP